MVVNEAEAKTVREIFESYVQLGSVSDLQADLNRRGIVSKRWVSTSGRTRGGVKFGRGPLYWLLRNRVYIGRVSHKGQVFEGRQAPIVDPVLWEKVQGLLSAKNADRAKRHVCSSDRSLSGFLFDDHGNAMSPSYTTRPSGRRYAYYVSQALLQNAKDRAGAVPKLGPRRSSAW